MHTCSKTHLLETGILGVAGNVAITKFDLSEDKTHKEYLLEQSLIFQRNENQRMLKKMKDLEAEIGTLTDKVVLLKSELESKSDKVSEKEEELSRLVLRLKEAESGYISEDGSDDENEDNSSKIDSEYLKELKSSKELAEKEAKEAKENLANAKMIISSLEESNKKMNADLRNRLHDSNAAIVSLLDQNAKYEQEIQELKAQQAVTTSNQTIMNLDENDCEGNDAEGDNNHKDYIGDIDASFHDSDVDLEKEEMDFDLKDALD